MAVLPPGTLLQLIYLKERLKDVPPGLFVEIGPGSGNISQLLLSLGWRGVAYDIEPATIARLRMRFADEIRAERFQAINADWLRSPSDARFDLVLSSMVMEHLDEQDENAFVARARDCLTPTGRMISIVPASPEDWGIEDEIAGHYRRYTRDSATTLLGQSGWIVLHTAGLTFPVSNMLLPLSNYLVRRAESAKLSLSMVERTKRSGARDVPMKTRFPGVFGAVLNFRTIYPLHLLQKAFRNSKRALVLYVEAVPVK